jgi:5-formyltetrahydrofolate cyclo-ligase
MTGMSHPDKVALRARLLEARQARSAQDRASARSAIRSLVLARAAADGWRAVAAYEPMRTEPGSVELLDELVAADVRVLVPVLLPDRDLDWSPWGSDARLGVDAIAACDAVLAPALAVSRGGVRLGRGGGSYDRALARCGAGVTVIAVLFDGEVLESVPADAWDMPVHEVVTPRGFLVLQRH